MSVLANRDLNRLAAHTTLHQLAWGVSTAFSAVFLWRQGLSPAAIYLYLCAIIVVRFLFRPVCLFCVKMIGLRSTLIAGTFLYAVQSPLLALVHRPGIALWVYCVVTAIAQVLYWACYHALFATAGDIERRGSQVGWRQLLIGVAGIVGPAMGGFTLTFAGPGWAFGAAAAIEIGAILPLLSVADPPINSVAPKGALQAAKTGVLLFATDGWIFNSSAWAWSLILFEALGARFYAYGSGLAAAALAGAFGGLFLGRLIDSGRARQAAWINGTVVASNMIAKAICGQAPILVLAVAIGTTMLGGLYTPSLMTAVYNQAKSSPCPLRFHLAAEAGWDIGGALACLAAAALYNFGASLHTLILLALPVVALQAFLLHGSYAVRQRETGMVGRELPGS